MGLIKLHTSLEKSELSPHIGLVGLGWIPLLLLILHVNHKKMTRLGLCSSLPLTTVKMREHENQFREGGIIINIYALVANDSWTFFFFLNNKGKRPVLSCINKSEFTKAKMLEKIQHKFTQNCM